MTEKPRVLLGPAATTAISKAMAEGNSKHGRGNYYDTNRPVSLDNILQGVLRHVMAIQWGEWEDPISGAQHLAHIAARCIVALEAAGVANLLNDMDGPYAELLPAYVFNFAPTAPTEFVPGPYSGTASPPPAPPKFADSALDMEDPVFFVNDRWIRNIRGNE